MADRELVQMAREAKSYMIEANGAAPSDEIIMRAAVTYGMLTRAGFARVRDQDGRPHTALPVWDRAYAIALIACGFEDHPPCTPERAELFAVKLEALRG